uniref:AGC-kinase C-terminal domain-containing protein n=1 Tax=Panagrellus redivivus TaxID=6233 RepID=A0A7E4WDE9_PANRE
MGCCCSKEFHEREYGISDSELKKVPYTIQPPEVFDDLDTDNDQKGKVAVDHIFRPTREVYGQPAKDLEEYNIDWHREYKLHFKNRPSPSDFPAFAHEKQ